MNTLPYSTTDMMSEEVTSVLSIFNSLERKYEVCFTNRSDFPFREFSLFETYQGYSTGPVIEVKENGNVFYITFTRVFYQLPSASRYPVPPTGEYQTWCVLPLQNQYGHILVKTETFLDKVHELVHPIEVDFEEDPAFSKEFYVLSGDALKERSLLNDRMRNYLKELTTKDLWIEVSGDKLIVGNKKRIQSEATLEMADFLRKIAELQK